MGARRWSMAALLTLTTGLLALRWVDATDLQIPVLQSVFPVIGLVAVVLLVGCALLRDLRLTVVAALVALAPTVLAVRALIPDTVRPRAGDEVVMVSNLQYGGADAEEIVQTVRARRITSLVLVEVTPQAVRRLTRAGLDALLPHSVGTAREGTDGTMIRSTHQLTAVENVYVPGRFDQPVARVDAPAGAYVLRAAHPYPPIPTLATQWREQLGDLAAWRRAQPADVPLVIAGDFNSSSAHPGFRAVADTMRDAHAAAGGGWVRTWPEGASYPAFVQIDHVLVRRFAVVSAGVQPLPGTDHAAVWARLRIGAG